MFTKLLVSYCTIAILSIAIGNLADTIQVNKVKPGRVHYQYQNQACQQYANYYEKTYKKYYKEYYDNYYKQYYANQQPKIPNNVEAKWICTDPKTKYTVIIGSNQISVNGHGQPQPHYPPQQNRPSPHYPPQNPQPKYPENNHPDPKKSNTNGVGIIDIK